MTILNEICFGPYHFTVAKLLRETLFLSVMLLNSEVWINLTQKNIDTLEKLDRILIKKILNSARSTPTSVMYLDTCIPVRFLIQAKRLMFLHYILTRNEDEIVYKVYQMQKSSPVKGDWSELIKEDLKLFELNHLTEDEIGKMKKVEWKKLVKDAMNYQAFKYLTDNIKGMTKAKDLVYDKFEMQKYLESDMLTKREKLLVFSLRAHMIKVGHNYGNKQICPLCQDPDTDDSQIHLINCDVLKEECQDIKNKTVVYSDLYSCLLYTSDAADE